MSFAAEKVTWESESAKVFSGTEFQSGSASTLRCVQAALENAKDRISHADDPIIVIDSVIQWMACCLYSCNMENFKNK